MGYNDKEPVTNHNRLQSGILCFPVPGYSATGGVGGGGHAVTKSRKGNLKGWQGQRLDGFLGDVPPWLLFDGWVPGTTNTT